MKLVDLKKILNKELVRAIKKEGIDELRPCQKKAIKKGLLKRKNLLVCTPTASGKTLIAELAAVNSILKNEGKAIYIVPLKALANEKYKEFTRKYNGLLKIALSIGNLDSASPNLRNHDFIICTAEKLDSLLRHKAYWLRDVSTVIVDEIHLINDVSRGPTLEILITLLKKLLKNTQVIGLSATIGNPEELASWLDAELVIDNWRPVKLKKGIFYDNELEFIK